MMEYGNLRVITWRNSPSMRENAKGIRTNLETAASTARANSKPKPTERSSYHTWACSNSCCASIVNTTFIDSEKVQNEPVPKAHWWTGLAGAEINGVATQQPHLKKAANHLQFLPQCCSKYLPQAQCAR